MKPIISVFEGLLLAAKEAGCTRLRFEVDLAAHFAEQDAWTVATGEKPVVRGRTGQDALAKLVERERRGG